MIAPEFDLIEFGMLHATAVYGEVAVGKAAAKISAAMGNHPGVRILPSPPKLYIPQSYMST